MDAGGSGAIGSEIDREEEEAENEILRDRFRLCTISIAEAEGLICRSMYLYEFFYVFNSLLIVVFYSEIFQYFLSSEAVWNGNFSTDYDLRL